MLELMILIAELNRILSEPIRIFCNDSPGHHVDAIMRFLGNGGIPLRLDVSEMHYRLPVLGGILNHNSIDNFRILVMDPIRTWLIADIYGDLKPYEKEGRHECFCHCTGPLAWVLLDNLHSQEVSVRTIHDGDPIEILLVVAVNVPSLENQRLTLLDLKIIELIR